MSTAKILSHIKDNAIQFVDLRFTDSRGKEQHVTVPAAIVDEDFLQQGKTFDGSSITGWKPINNSDMLLLPDLAVTPVSDPFCEAATQILRCDVVEPSTMQAYERDPRSVAKRAEAYLKDTGIADICLIGPEPEFFVFDDVRWGMTMQEAFYHIDSEEGAWNSGKAYAQGNRGHRPAVKGGYFPVPPVDSSHDMRSAMCLALAQMGLVVETHHHEVATANQNEIATRCNTLVAKADEMQLFKYVIHNIAHAYGKTATFMPKPLVGDNGSGMHCHQSLAKHNKNLFSGELYAGLSELALYYIGGIIKHARAINIFTNPGTNSYKRLVPGFEAPVMLAYSSRNRSAAIRIPSVAHAQASRIEVRFPDPLANPYLAFSAMLMAGLDGIKQRILPGNPLEMNLYELSEKAAQSIPKVCHSLEQAIDSLYADSEFLLLGNVFTQELLDAYVGLKRAELTRLDMTTHPVEYDMYYSA